MCARKSYRKKQHRHRDIQANLFIKLKYDKNFLDLLQFTIQNFLNERKDINNISKSSKKKIKTLKRNQVNSRHYNTNSNNFL